MSNDDANELTHERIVELLGKLNDVELQAITKMAHRLGRTAPRATPDKPQLTQDYWHIEDGHFDCFIPACDAATQVDAAQIAYSKIHPWYFTTKDLDSTFFAITRRTRDEYIDWLRKH